MYSVALLHGTNYILYCLTLSMHLKNQHTVETLSMQPRTKRNADGYQQTPFECPSIGMMRRILK